MNTSVLTRDPESLNNFAEHDIYIRIFVLEEFDGLRKRPWHKR